MWPSRARPAPHLEAMMKDEKLVKKPEEGLSRAEDAAAKTPRRRPFAPPAVEELGDLREMTKQEPISGGG